MAPKGDHSGDGGLPATRSRALALPVGQRRLPDLRCRNCAGVTELSPVARRSGPARCRHCGASLKWECPVCRRSHWVDEPKCACGFPLALREPLDPPFRGGPACLPVATTWPRRDSTWSRSRSMLPTTWERATGWPRSASSRADIEHARMACELAVAGKKLVAAAAGRRGLAEARRSGSPEVQAGLEGDRRGPAAGRGARGPRPQARAGRSAGCAGLLPQEPGDRGRPARGRRRPEPLPAGRPGRP